MAHPFNKDALIAVMGKRQEELEKMVKLQADQLGRYQESLLGYQVLVQKYEQQIAGLQKQSNLQDQLVKGYRSQESNLKKTIDALTERNKQITTRLENLERMIQISRENAHTPASRGPNPDTLPAQ